MTNILIFYIAGSVSAAQAAYLHMDLLLYPLQGLSCYLIYADLYSSAVTVSQDIAVRQSIRRPVTEQSKLLGSIGTVQMEQDYSIRF
jgi:hypothetical protein